MMTAALRGKAFNSGIQENTLGEMFDNVVPKDDLFLYSDDLDAQRAKLGVSEAPFNMDFLSLTKDDTTTEGPAMRMPWDVAGVGAEKENGFSFASTESPMSSANLDSFGSSIASPSASFGFESCAPPPGLNFPTSLDLKVQDVPPPPPAPVAPTPTAACACKESCADTAEDDGTMPSIGSALHATEECTPCKFFRGRRGCKDGNECKLCHFPHNELTYSGIRRMMRKKGLEKHTITEDTNDMPDTPVFAAPVVSQPPLVPPPPPMMAPRLPQGLFKPPPGLEHPSLSPAYVPLGAASFGGRVSLSF